MLLIFGIQNGITKKCKVLPIILLSNIIIIEQAIRWTIQTSGITIQVVHCSLIVEQNKVS